MEINLSKSEIKIIQYTNIEYWKTDQRNGLHCSNCYEESFIKLLNNPNIPRILCIQCLINIKLTTLNTAIKNTLSEIEGLKFKLNLTKPTSRLICNEKFDNAIEKIKKNLEVR